MHHLRNCLLLVLACATCADAQWKRWVISANRDWFDTATPHPLEYFINDPFLRDDGGDFCTRCTPEDKATIHLTRKGSAKVQPVGTLEGFKIYDVFYYFDDEPKIAWKSILVEVKPSQFIEIYHLQPTLADIGPSFIQHTHDVTLLATHDPQPGTGVFSYKAYWWFGNAKGPVLVDLAVIWDAAQSVLPQGMGVWKGNGLNFEELNYKVAVWKAGDANCCPTGGSVEVGFKIVRGTIEITSKRYIRPN
jgi:hypothetical protein